jgi:hypothetical protein
MADNYYGLQFVAKMTKRDKSSFEGLVLYSFERCVLTTTCKYSLLSPITFIIHCHLTFSSYVSVEGLIYFQVDYFRMRPISIRATSILKETNTNQQGIETDKSAKSTNFNDSSVTTASRKEKHPSILEKASNKAKDAKQDSSKLKKNVNTAKAGSTPPKQKNVASIAHVDVEDDDFDLFVGNYRLHVKVIINL